MKFKREIISLKKLLQLLRQHKIYVPQEGRFLDAVFYEKQSSAQSCEADVSWKKEAILSVVTVTWVVKRGVTVV